MKTAEEIIKSNTSVTNWNFLEHVYHSGEVYKQILSAMEKYGKQQYNQAIYDAAENVECGLIYSPYPQCEIDKKSILKLFLI